MAWVRLDDQFFINRKARSAGPSGQLLYLAGLCWCAMQLNDGHINAEDLPAIAGLAAVEPSVADRLVTVGLWAQTEDGYHVPDYLSVNPSREQVIAEREAGAERQRRSREKSRRDSHRDSWRSNGVSAGDPSRPVPTTDPVSRPLVTHEGDDPTDDDGNVPAAVWTHYAELKLPLEPPGTVRSPAAWKRTCARNARTELAAQAATWWQTFDIEPYRLAQALVDGQAPRYATRRNGDSS